MIAEKVEFKNTQGVKLTGKMELPVGKKVIGTAIFAHCFTCNKNLNTPTHIAKALTQNGFAVLRFDFTGLGESEGEFSNTNFTSNIIDLVAAADFLKDNFEAPSILIGHSLGGAAAISAAGLIPSLKALVTIGAPFAPNHVTNLFSESIEKIRVNGKYTVNIGGRPFEISSSFLNDVKEQNQLRVLNQLNIPILILHSPTDAVVDVGNAANIYKAAKHPKSFIALEGADHLLSKKEDSHYVADLISSWSKKYIPIQNPNFPKVKKEVAVKIEREKFISYISTGDHSLIADEPTDAGGQNMGPTPYDLLMASLGTCTAMTLRMYADFKKLPLEAVEVHLSYAKEHAEDCEKSAHEKPLKIDTFYREIELIGDLTDVQKDKLLQIANRCPVHKTLLSTIEIKTKLLDK